MADREEIIRTIYKLEIDDSGYIRGVDSMVNSTQKFSQAQEQANQRLQANQSQLKTASDITENARRRLEQYTGTNERYRRTLELNLSKAQAEQAKLNDLVVQSQKDYDAATKAAQDFANITQKAANLQPPGGGRIPAPNVIAPPQPLPNVLNQFPELNELPDLLNATQDEFEQLRIAINAVEKAMAGMNQESEEFKQLAPIVEQGKKVLQEYDNATKSAAGSQRSIREQLRLGREELVRLEQAGQGVTQQYFELEKQVAKLTDEFQDQQQRIRILASDTKLLDFGKAAITAATSAFQAYTAVEVLAGEGNEELQKKVMQLFAAMQLLQSLEQLSNLTRREGTLATLAQSAAQSVYTAVVGTSTGALRAFRLALLGTGIGAAAIVIGLLVKKYIDWKNSIDEVSAEQKTLNAIQEKAVDGYAKEVAQLEILRRQLTDLNTPQKQRIELAKEYNKTADEGNKIDLKQVDNINLLNGAIDRQIAKIKERALAQAAVNVTQEAATKLFQTEQKLTEVNAGFVLNIEKIDEQIKKVRADFDQAAISFALSGKRADQQLAITLKNTFDALNNIKEANTEFNRAATLTAKLPGAPTPTTATTETKRITTSEIKSDFEQRKKTIDEEIRKLNEHELTTEIEIRKEFSEKLKVAVEEINADKTLKPKERTELVSLATTLNTAELNKALDDLRKKRLEAQQKLNDELHDLEEKNTQDQLNLIQDEFERRAALIDFNEKKELEDAKQNTQERLDSLELNRLLLGEQEYQNAKAEIIQIGEQQALDITRKFAQERQDLSVDIFEKSLQRYEDVIAQATSSLDAQSAIAIRVASDNFLKGIISYKDFEAEVQRIKREAAAKSRDIEIQNKQAELFELDSKLATMLDHTTKAYKELVDKRKKLNDDLNNLQIQDAQKDAEDKQAETTAPQDDRTQRIVQYTEAIGQFADSVIQFWQKANDAEQKSLDRSIAIQERRVNEAQRIAERGNAEYLKSETDRLTQLQVARENAARRQLAIDAALQASQILVGITGAIAKIASGIGAAETIAEIAVIVGALATGYGLVKSLQGNQPRLKKGDPYVRREGHPAGDDTIPVWLTEGERVVTRKENKDYFPALQAIHERKVDPSVINEFVKNYSTKRIERVNEFVRVNSQIKPVAQPDYQRIKEVSEIKLSHDGKLAALISEQNKKLDENNDLLKQTNRALRSMGVNVNMDKNGLAISLMEAIEQKKISIKT